MGEDSAQQHPDSIAIVWHVDDVADRCEALGVDLPVDEKRRVLQLMKREHDANVGINWDVIDAWIGHVADNRGDP